MKQDELRCVMATKAAPNERMLTEIPKEKIGCHYSSITDYLDKMVNHDSSMMRKIDELISRFHLGAVSTTINGHYGSVLPCINRKGMIVGGNVIYYSTEDGQMLHKDALIDHLYSWYTFDYYVDPSVFFGEHLYRGRQTAVVQEEETALLGALAYPDIDWLAVGSGNNLTDEMMEKLLGRQVILLPDDFCCDFWMEHFGSKFKVDESFVHRGINQYLIDFIHSQHVP